METSGAFREWVLSVIQHGKITPSLPLPRTSGGGTNHRQINRRPGGGVSSLYYHISCIVSLPYHTYWTYQCRQDRRHLGAAHHHQPRLLRRGPVRLRTSDICVRVKLAFREFPAAIGRLFLVSFNTSFSPERDRPTFLKSPSSRAKPAQAFEPIIRTAARKRRLILFHNAPYTTKIEIVAGCQTTRCRKAQFGLMENNHLASEAFLYQRYRLIVAFLPCSITFCGSLIYYRMA